MSRWRAVRPEGVRRTLARPMLVTCIGCALVAPRVADAQTADAYPLTAVDVRPVLKADQQMPRYPEILRGARVSGSVRYSVVIDHAGARAVATERGRRDVALPADIC